MAGDSDLKVTDVDGKIIYENLYEWIENKKIIAIGEIGLEDLTEKEYEVFKKQLDIDEINDEELDKGILLNSIQININRAEDFFVKRICWRKRIC